MVLKLKYNVHFFIQHLISINFYGIPLIVLFYVASITYLYLSLFIIIFLFNIFTLIYVLFTKNAFILTIDSIIINTKTLKKTIMLSDVEKILTQKTRWYYFLFNYISGDFIIYFKNSEVNNQLCFTNKQLRTIKKFANENMKDFKIYFLKSLNGII